ncbi:aldo/keto reductase [Catenulispora acidiphila DSM 44928]|uniref:Aldo/keto reductase n=1 Tax=Catenulispora acidiphila (strain DSM 44928 / JCM 14897 / NBRC 102108 / NRRL B-24433 / ID139908) TaxID=479433 RepID=C7Q5W4_CATAD|nr:oxidoreductase [Catenulispora acidiphila]ACU70061.1 aldo/keto reductase [Catenulispora acidiphila DSM 44928]
MTNETPGGVLTLAEDLTLTRVGYGAIQLAGPVAWGPPRDRGEAIAVLRAVVDAGITHIDTSDYYGPYVVNDLIREALHPYPRQLRIATKVGARRTPDRGWPAALSGPELVQAVHDNLRRLDVPALDLVNLRMTDTLAASDIRAPFTVLAELREQGLIRNLGVSNVGIDQLEAARAIAPVVAVQNHYNVAFRQDDDLVDHCAAHGIAFVPFFPLGGFRPLQLEALDHVAGDLGRTPRQVALAWLLHRSPTTLLIPGTSRVAHLRENIDAAAIELPGAALATLEAIAGRPAAKQTG